MKVVELEKVIELLHGRDIPKIGELHRILTQMSFDVPKNSEKNSQPDITNVWYEIPTICRYVTNDHLYARGLLFHEYLIDLSTGRACTSQSVLKAAIDMGIDPDDAIIENFGWVDFSEIFLI